jgi:hypothetical protein
MQEDAQDLQWQEAVLLEAMLPQYGWHAEVLWAKEKHLLPGRGRVSKKLPCLLRY